MNDTNETQLTGATDSFWSQNKPWLAWLLGAVGLAALWRLGDGITQGGHGVMLIVSPTVDLVGALICLLVAGSKAMTVKTLTAKAFTVALTVAAFLAIAKGPSLFEALRVASGAA